MLDGIRILLNTGIDPRLLNESQKTALADANFHPDILAVFLQHCIQLISQADTEGLVRMLQIGISVNSLDRTDSQQNTLLHWACHFAQPACVRLLLERSANPNVANRDGVTPLHLCLIKADLELVRLLIQYGANPSVYVKQGPYADKNGFDLCSLSDKSVQLMQLISQQHHQQSQHQLYSQPTQMSAASSTSPSVANGSDSGATAAAASAVAVPADEARARPMNGSDFAKDSVLDRAFWPRPQQSQLLIGQHFRLPVGQQQQQPLVLSLNHQDGEPALHWLAGRLAQFRPRTLVVAKPVQGVSLEIGHRVCRGRPEGYYLEVTSSGIRLLAADARGLFNGAAVLSSLLTVCAEISMGLVPGIRVWDWPTTLVRGVLVDCSSGLLPRPEALISVAESAACMRANQLHLFFRLGSTAHACPYAQEDLRRVVRSAQELCLTPVLAIDIGIAVSDLTQVQSQADVLLGAFPPNCPLHLGPRLSAHLAQGPEQEAPVWLGLGRQHLYLASSGFSLPPWLQKLPITCIDHCLPRDRPEDRATYLHSALPEFVLAPATGAWLSFTGCHSLQRTRLCPVEPDAFPESKISTALQAYRWNIWTPALCNNNNRVRCQFAKAASDGALRSLGANKGRTAGRVRGAGVSQQTVDVAPSPRLSPPHLLHRLRTVGLGADSVTCQLESPTAQQVARTGQAGAMVERRVGDSLVADLEDGAQQASVRRVDLSLERDGLDHRLEQRRPLAVRTKGSPGKSLATPQILADVGNQTAEVDELLTSWKLTRLSVSASAEDCSLGVVRHAFVPLLSRLIKSNVCCDGRFIDSDEPVSEHSGTTDIATATTLTNTTGNVDQAYSLAKSLTSLPGLSGVVSCDWDGGGIGPHLLTSLPVHAVTLGLAWNPAVLNNGAADDSSAVAGAASRWLPEPLAKLEPAESAVSQADKPSPFQALFCGLLPDQEIELRPVPKLHLKSPGEGTPEERLIGFTAELALLCYHMLAKPMASPAQRTDCANRVIKLKQAARPAWAGVYLSTQHLNTALATFDTLVSRLLNSVDLPDI
uniref:ANK_REP_REGION domain-containing protein n=1 Tax=Macrostomum lignano TaxID=282301 RepID=A0A1I8IFU8_9PLAT